MRLFAKLLLGLVALIAIALFSLPMILRTEALKASLLAHIEMATGRKVTVGKMGLELFPEVSITLEEVTLQNPEWLNNDAMMKAGKLAVGVELMPLLQRQLKVKALTLENPIIHLVKKGAQANWQFGVEKKAEISNVRSGEKAQKAQIALNEVVIKNGTFIFEDAASGKSGQEFSHINMKVNAPDLNDKAKVELETLYGSQKLNILMQLAHPLEFAAGKASQADIQFTSDVVQFEFKGEVNKGGIIPSLKGIIIIPEIEAARFSAAKKQEEIPSGIQTVPVPTNSASHWSNDPIKLEGLNAVNANLTVAIGKLVLEKTTISDMKVSVTLTNGALKAETGDIASYNGILKAVLQLSSSGAMGISALLKDIDVQPLLHDFAQYDQLSGKINGNFAFSSIGQSQRALISNLNGNGQFQMNDGKVKGKVIAALLQGKGTDETSFSAFSARFAANQGIITNNDLKVTTPLLHVSGTGSFNLPEYSVDYTVRPALLGVAEGKEENALAVPLKITGNLDNPLIRPDIKGAIEEGLKNPEGIKNTARQIKENLLNKDALRGLLR